MTQNADILQALIKGEGHNKKKAKLTPKQLANKQQRRQVKYHTPDARVQGSEALDGQQKKLGESPSVMSLLD